MSRRSARACSGTSHSSSPKRRATISILSSRNTRIAGASATHVCQALDTLVQTLNSIAQRVDLAREPAERGAARNHRLLLGPVFAQRLRQPGGRVSLPGEKGRPCLHETPRRDIADEKTEILLEVPPQATQNGREDRGERPVSLNPRLPPGRGVAQTRHAQQ